MKDKAARKAETAPEAEVHGMAFASAPHPMLVFDLQTHFILDVNNMALRQYGYSRQEFLAMTVLDIRPSEDISQFRRLVLDPGQKGRSTAAQWRHKAKDGTVFPVSITSWKTTFRGRKAELVLARAGIVSDG